MEFIDLIHFCTKFLHFLWIKVFFCKAKNLIIALFWFLSSDSTIDAFNSFVCETGAGNHILGALFVDLEPLLLMKPVPKLTGTFYILSSLSPGTTSSMVRKQFPSLFILTDSSNGD
ncbi:unnamed protein product [Brassica oleracea]